MELHPKAVGDRSMLAIMAVLQDLGDLYLPFSENTRTDLILDLDGDLKRIQCKTGRLRAGAVRFSVCSNYGHHPNPLARQRDYHGQVDCFAVFCGETNAVYLIPIEDLPVTREAALRVQAPRNGPFRRVRMAADYEVGRFLIEGLRGPSGA